MVEYSNVLICNGIGVIGGIETFFYELAKKYKDLDLTIVYQAGDLKQIERISQYARCVRLTEPIKCKKCFLMYKTPIDMVQADEYIQLIHANYKVQNLVVNTDPRITSYYGVSKWVAKDYEELLRNNGVMKPVEVCYNPITIEKPQKILRLISATRLTKEKGKDRMIILANRLTEAGIPFIWLVFTNDFDKIDNPNVVYMKPTLNIRNYIADSDYLVQLSDTEGYPYSILESLCLGTPVITTPIPSIAEMNPVGYTLPFDMKEIPINDIYKKIPKVKNYKPNEDIWGELLDHSKTTYNPSDKIKVIAIRTYNDNGQWTMQDTEKEVSKEEAKYLMEKGYVRLK